MADTKTTCKRFEYLRVSVTDRCNFRCTYCMPPEGVPKIDHQQILRYEEIVEIVRTLVEEGVFRVRVTGGEPLVRKGIVDLIKGLKQIPGIEDLSLTTNGHFLQEFAGGLKEAGLDRINISLDSLIPEKFSQITRGGDLRKILAGIDSSIQAGLNPVKINVVLLKNFNENEILAFADLAASRPIHVRFIERMPFQEKGEDSSFIPQEQVFQTIQEKFHLFPCPTETGGGPARMFDIEDGKGKIGFISPRTNPYCAHCNRLRLTANGILVPCLDSNFGVSIRGLSPEEIKKILQDLAVHKRSAAKPCAQFDHARCVSLSDIGG